MSTVLIFAKTQEGVSDLLQAFSDKGHTVYVELTSAGFFQRLSTSSPAKVMISLSVETKLQNYLFTYVRSRYKIPVYTFHEKNGNGIKPDQIRPSRYGFHIPSKDSKQIITSVVESPPIPKTLEANALELPPEIHAFFEAMHLRLQKATQFFISENFDLFSLTIESADGKCHLSMAIPQEEVSPEKRKIFFTQIFQELEASFSGKVQIDVYETQVGRQVVDKMRSVYDFPLVGKMDSVEMGLFVRPIHKEEILPFEWNEESKLFFVPVETWMIMGELDFHVYIWMPANQHRVLYVRRGQRMLDDQFARLKTRGMGDLGVLPADIKIYEQRRRALHLPTEKLTEISS